MSVGNVNLIFAFFTVNHKAIYPLLEAREIALDHKNSPFENVYQLVVNWFCKRAGEDGEESVT